MAIGGMGNFHQRGVQPKDPFRVYTPLLAMARCVYESIERASGKLGAVHLVITQFPL
jgi:hypothetical protein